jgi:hypothetical protein
MSYSIPPFRKPTAEDAGFFLYSAFLVILLSLSSGRNLTAEENADSTASALSYSLRVSGEAEHISLSDSSLNPSNILERPDTRLEAFTVGNLLYKALGGVFETEVRLGHEFTEDGSSHSLTTFDINQLYYQKKIEGMSILAGRKKVRWGVGYSYSPTDLVTQLRNPEDPEDRLGKTKGSDVLQLSFNNEKTQIDIAYVPHINWNNDGTFISNNRLAMRWYRFMDPCDLSLVGTVDEDGRWATGLNTSVTFGKALELHAEYLYTSSKNRQYPDTSLDPASFTMPYFGGRSGGYHEILLGGQYTFENNLNLTLEYLFTSAGYSDSEFGIYARHVNYLHSQYPTVLDPDPSIAGLYESASNFSLPLRKHYLFSRLYHPDLMRSISFEMYSYLSLSDGSGFFVIQPKYEKAKNYEVYLRLKKFWGKNDSEFGLVPDDFSAIVGVSLFLGS